MKYFAKAGKFGPQGLYTTLLETHTGKTEAQYAADAHAFLFEQAHPRFQVHYAETVYLPMLEYSDDKNPATPDLQMIVNHDDPEREYEYAVEKVDHLAAENGWQVISMKNDWDRVFDFSRWFNESSGAESRGLAIEAERRDVWTQLPGTVGWGAHCLKEPKIT